MGAAESKSLTSTSEGAIRGRIGFHVLRCAEGSPAEAASIEPYFDYIVGLNGQALNSSSMDQSHTSNVEELLAEVVEAHEGRALSLQVWSSKRAELREVTVIPSRDWSSNNNNGEGSHQDMQPSLLGLSLRLCNPDGALENVWHILEVLDDSPAFSAGLVPFGDYVLGAASNVLHKESDFYKLVEEHVDKPLRLFVYNSDFDVTREVVIVPNRAWNSGEGQGLLGCGVGYGVLHRIPKPKDPVAGRPQQQPQPQPQSSTNGFSERNAYGNQPQPSPQKLPTRMQASIANPSTPPRSSSPGYASRAGQQPPGQGFRGYSAQDQQQRLGLGSPNSRSGMPPPRSPSSMSHRSSVAEVIAEEEE